MKTILLFKRPVEVLRVFVDLKFSLIGLLFFKIKFSKNFLIQVKKNFTYIFTYSYMKLY